MEFELDKFNQLTKYEKNQQLNKALFESEEIFYVFVDEKADGELYFLANTTTLLGKVSYECAYRVLFADKFVSGDPVMELLEEQLPHLMKYEITTKYKFELLQ